MDEALDGSINARDAKLRVRGKRFTGRNNHKNVHFSQAQMLLKWLLLIIDCYQDPEGIQQTPVLSPYKPRA